MNDFGYRLLAVHEGGLDQSSRQHTMLQWCSIAASRHAIFRVSNSHILYMNELIAPMMFFWVCCGVSLATLVEIQNLFVLDMDASNFIQYCCHWLLPTLVLHNDTSSLNWIAKDSFFAIFVLGWVITNGAGVASYPIDTVRRRMMVTSGEAVKYKSSLDAFSHSLKNEGAKSMFKGACANILRAIAGAGVMSGYDKLQLIVFGKKYGSGGG